MDWSVMFSAGIFLIGFLSFLLVGFNTLLNAKIRPLEKRLDSHVADTTKKIDNLADGQKRLEDGQKQLEAKLDRLLRDKGK